MPRVQRSPTASSSVNTSVLQAKSDSDIPAAVSNSPVSNINTASRQGKRPCPEFSPANELQDIKHEIIQMLSSWKREQEERLTNFISQQNTSLSKLVSDIADLKQQNLEIQKSNGEIEKAITFITEQYDDMMKKIDSLQKENQLHKDRIIHLEYKIQDIQQLSRSSCVEIRNVPAVVNESVYDLATIISKVGAAVDMTLNHTELRDAYRLPGKPGTIRPIVAEFVNVQVKNKLITSVRDFNKTHPNDDRLNTKCIGLPGDRRPVYVAEYLPATSRKLFYEAREFAKQKLYKFCWTANGNIFLRKSEGSKQILVRSTETLRNLQLDIKQ
ncbi:uncharacterized protein LOC124634054 [Helicoverpa zea]|uniref:uncharacterized protein LOC124632800 n=1 Tax=Helicoverpa zea TaxID=7113 RepID=UPI001F5A4C57|nr:uncharacterized protein LOC124632800 [Helicoverpa zea]XP_047025417.1 uncharacterized protein LOC124634054 [Helicoverpa zea]